MTKKKFTFKALIAVAAAASASTATAQDATNAPVTTPAAVSATTAPARNLAFPGVFGAASAVASPSGSAYAALTVVDPRGGVSGEDTDGSLSFGYTIGNPIKNVSATFSVNVNSLTDSFGDSGNLNASFSRLVRSGDRSLTFAGFSVGRIAGWGDASGADETYSGYVSHLTAHGAADIPVQYTVGYGDSTNLTDDGLGEIEEGFFAGFGVGVTEIMSVSASVTETQLNLGTTVAIPAVSGLAVSAGVYDVTDNTDRQQFALTVAYGF